jgi:hypothetical protein
MRVEDRRAGSLGANLSIRVYLLSTHYRLIKHVRFLLL